VTLFYTISTWNPYQVFLVSSRFALGRSQRPIVSSASYDGSGVSPESIVSVFAPDLAGVIEAAQSSNLPFTLAGTLVSVQDSQGVSRAAPLLFLRSK